MPTLDETLIRTNNVLAALEGLLVGDAAETPVPDSSVSYTMPTPTYNEANDEWVLVQGVADTDGLYKGLYQLAISTGCSVITIVSHNIVTPDDGVPARFAPCGGSLTNSGSVTALNGLQISKLEFRSKNPFTVTIKLGMKWCYKWDFTVSQSTWTRIAGTYPYTEGSATGFGDTISGTALQIEKVINQYVESIVVNFFGVGSGSSSFRIYVDGALIHSSTFNNGEHLVNIGSHVGTLRVYADRSFAFGIDYIEMRGKDNNPFGNDNC
jgi:hypothetical protein